MAAVGLVIGTPGDLSDSLAAEIILHKIPNDYAAIKAVLHGRRPLTVDFIKEALDNKRQEASSSVSASAPTIKQESAYRAAKNWPTFKPGWHNPETKHLIEEFRKVKRKQLKPTPAAQPAVESTHDRDSDSSIQTTAGALISIKHALLAGGALGEDHCFLDSGASHHMFRDRLADKNFLKSAGEGFVYIKAKDGTPIKLKCLHVPKLATTLLSLGRFYERGCDIVRTSSNSFDIACKDSVLLSGAVEGRVWSAKIHVTSENPQDTPILRH
ncbi:uncharacterized protein VP01_4378g3 [Puccinia sorghi]|uniref:Uncharacterized protein n=1 Tax=Puccinia sorghi TaxID=27349 RepID=A0A0L6URQ7_9BASI|nr:uncharacterized protein VP01_4378g3 [Puccinia sorghi]